VTPRREKELLQRPAYVHYRTGGSGANTRPNVTYQNCRIMVEICTLLPTGFPE
jgi:hypothetical protein